MAANSPVACFVTTKHSWRGKYKRVFVIGTKAITTLNPSNFEETNSWEYGTELLSIMPGQKAANEFTIVTKKKAEAKKTNSLTFSTEFRVSLLTHAQRFQPKFGGKAMGSEAFPAYKHHWSETRKNTTLQATPFALVQLRNNRIIAEYNYKDIEAICLISDYPGGFVVFYGGCGRMHLFALERRDELLKKIGELAGMCLGIPLRVKKKSVTLDQFRDNRLGKFSNDLAVTSLAEFPVTKLTRRSPDPVPRLFCLSETCIVERDPGTYSVVTIRPLSGVFALVRDPHDPQKFMVQHLDDSIRVYLSTDRDALLASLLDSVRATGNPRVCVQMAPTLRGQRFQPLRINPEEEIESLLLKFLVPNAEVDFQTAVRRFNANINYSGLVHAVTEDGWFKENKERLILQALQSLLQHGEKTDTPALIAGEFLAIRRLAASKAGFHAFTQVEGFKEQIGGKVVKTLRLHDDGVTHAGMDMLATLMQPMHENYDLAQEIDNKKSLLGSKPFLNKLLELLKENADAQTGALVINGLLDFFTFAICAPYSETTDAAQFDMVLHMVADLGRSIFSLFEHPSMAIVKAAGLIMKSCVEEGDEEMCARMQALSLAEGALLRHFHTSLFTDSLDNRMLTHRQLSRHLVALWMEKNPTAISLFERVMPMGLVSFLRSSDKVPQTEIDRLHQRDNLKAAQASKGKNKLLGGKKIDELMLHWRSRNRKKLVVKENRRPVVLRKRRQKVNIELNWAYFYYQFQADHARADLIWNYKTREELREALEAELRAFLSDKDLRGKFIISWNHTEFEVRYDTLAEEVKIGDHYLRLLLEDDPQQRHIHKPLEFFSDLYHRFLLTTKPSMKSMCLQAMSIVYGSCFEQIGHFNDTEYIVTMLNRCEDSGERDRILQFLNQLLNNPINTKRFIDAGGIRCLVDLLTLSHLHTQRASAPSQTNVIEASDSQLSEDEPEWYYTLGSDKNTKNRLGPIGFKKLKELYEEGELNAETKVWAQGMEGWRPIRQIAQLKWTLVATGTAVLNFSDLAVLCLNMLIRICQYYPSRDVDGAVVRPLPRCKRMLCEPSCLPHLVQLFLTFDPTIVEKTALLLTNIMEDNSLMPRLYLTGAFFFIMMYTGSNVLPVARFLKVTHFFQAFKADQETGRSILGPMLPKAMVCFLDNYGADKFASIFLGEFDTPETIWGNEMRRLMIEKIALHLSDYTPRLLSNTRALYEYIPIPNVNYPQLESELFCNIYYLRHLCDESKFADWPVKNHIELLKDILNAWKVEVEKKPATMSLDDAFTTLGLETGVGIHDQSKVRKAYYKMSMKYHPDKNPEGREVFEQVAAAYEFICSRDTRDVDGPNPENLVLILKAQTILFRRFPEVLAPYKYAGYPMLMVTVQRESEDENLFSSSVALLRAACELAYYTVKTSPLNAEEMRRERGIEILAQAFARCIAVVMRKTNDQEPAVQVCISILRCYHAASRFEECRERIMEVPQIVKDVSRCLWIQGAHSLTMSAIDCVNSFAVDEYLQNHMCQAGVLWHLVLLLFGYDYTLEEGGVEADESTNNQKFINNNSKCAIRALARLGGYRKSGKDATPENPTIQTVLGCLLTPFLSNQLAMPDPAEVLKLLNSNTENPYLIWDNATRAELVDYAEAQQEAVIKTGQQDPSLGSDFEFSMHKDELVLAGVFVRIFNEQPSFPLRNPQQFTKALLDFLGTEAQYFLSADMVQGSGGEVDEEKVARRLKRVCFAMESLRNVLRANQGTEVACKGHFKLLFSLLKYDAEPRLQELALEVAAVVTANKQCVANIASAQVLVYLLFAVQTFPQGQLLALETMHALVSNNKIIIEFVNRGGLVYALDMFCNSGNPHVRELAGGLFAKVMNDKLHGPKIVIILSKFLPVIFMDAMRDNPEAAVTMFEGTHENPELIWNDEARNKVEKLVETMKNKLFADQKENPELVWRLPEDFAVVYEELAGEVVVGGVFLRLLVKQPNWSFRKPKEFLVAMMDRYVQLTTKKSYDGNSIAQVEVITEALVSLLNAQNDLANQIPSLGHLHKLVPTMSRPQSEVQGSLLSVANEMCSSTTCVRSFAGMKCISHIQAAMKGCPKTVLGPACELLKKLFEGHVAPLIAQVMEGDFLQFCLDLLKDGLDMIEHSNAAKAHLVKALKALTRDLANGEAIAAKLDKCPWWATYKDQRHDLFISNTPISGYLTGPTASVAGYLTAGPATSAASMSSPPPMDEDAEAAKPRRPMAGNPDL